MTTTTIEIGELITLRRKISDKDSLAFEDNELDDIWVEAGESMTKAVYLCNKELVFSATRFADYTQNESQEKRSQIFDNLLRLLPILKKDVEEEEANASPGFRTSRIVGMKVQPPRRMELPGGDGEGS